MGCGGLSAGFALAEFEARYPGITKVDREPDGSIRLDESKV